MRTRTPTLAPTGGRHPVARAVVQNVVVVLLVLLVCLALARTLPAQAAGVVTTCNETSLRTALAGGGSVSFNCPGTPAITLTSQIVITADTSLNGSNGGSPMTLSGGSTTRLFVVTAGVALTLTHLTVTRGYATDNGGAIANNGTLVIQQCQFLSNTSASAWSGGAIVSVGPLDISQSEFAYNSAGNGGALFPRFSSGVTHITGSHFHDNQTTNTTNGWGGAMLVWDGAPVTITSTDWVANRAQHGGAIYVFANSVLTASNSLIASNVATGTNSLGGGIYNDTNGTATLNNVTLSSNAAHFDGGGMANFGTLTLNRSTLGGNSATDFGGGVANFGTTTVNTSTLSGNFASSFNGGGIYNFINATTTVNGSWFSGNSASSAGGGVSNDGTLTLNNSTLSDNSARNGFGGGIENLVRATLNNVTLSGNSAAQRGGGIDTGGGGTLTLTNSTLSGNSTGGAGGGIYNSSALNVGNSTLSGNSAAVGGGIYNSGTATVVNVTLDNRVVLTGTAHNLYFASGVLWLTNNIVNFDTSSGANCFGAGYPKSLSGGHNLANDTSCGLTATGDQQGPLVPILLGPLANHGGPTLTQLPRLGSAAIDGGDSAVCAAPPINNFDQRGAPRVGLGTGTACDIGAVERLASDSDRVPWLWLPLIKR